MSFSIRFYTTTSPSNKINKALGNVVYSPAIDFKTRPKDLNNLDIDLSNYSISQVTKINYAHIPSLNLYFFAKMLPSNIGTNHNILHLELDPLMTYKSQILGLKCITDRNSNNYNVYLKDDEQKITSQYKQFYHTFSGGNISFFKPHESILISLVGSD